MFHIRRNQVSNRRNHNLLDRRITSRYMRRSQQTNTRFRNPTVRHSPNQRSNINKIRVHRTKIIEFKSVTSHSLSRTRLQTRQSRPVPNRGRLLIRLNNPATQSKGDLEDRQAPSATSSTVTSPRPRARPTQNSNNYKPNITRHTPITSIAGPRRRATSSGNKCSGKQLAALIDHPSYQ